MMNSSENDLLEGITPFDIYFKKIMTIETYLERITGELLILLNIVRNHVL